MSLPADIKTSFVHYNKQEMMRHNDYILFITVDIFVMRLFLFNAIIHTGFQPERLRKNKLVTFEDSK